MKEAIGLASVDDPVEQICAVNDLYAQLDCELEQIAAVRLTAVRELRATGWSYLRIAQTTGLSMERVTQLCRAAGIAGRQPRQTG